MANVKIKGVTKRYEEKTVLSSFDLELKDGECFTLLGPSGCGKTVLMRLIAGFEKADAGVISIDGTVVTNPTDGTMISPDKRALGMVFQDYAVWPHMTVFDNIAYPLKLAGVDAGELKARTMRVIELVGLKGMDQRFPSMLSGGQQQRVALARALISEPQLLLLDEPLNILDANLREEMRFEIKALQQKLGVTIFYVTHDQEIALAIADRVAVMDEKGQLRQIGTPEEIYEKPADDYVFRFLGIANYLPVRRKGVTLYAGTADSKVEWVGEAPSKTGAVVTGGFRPGDLVLSRDGAGMEATIKRVSFLGAQFDFLIDIGGTMVRAALPSHVCVDQGLLFEEGDKCIVNLAAVTWFDGEIVVESKVNK